MKKQILILKLFFISAILSAQNTNKIKVKKVKWDIKIISEDSILWINRNNVVQIIVKGGDNYAINIQGGTIQKTANNYIVKVNEEGATTISVFEKLSNKKINVLATKLFPVKHIPSPQLFVCGVKADSVIDKLQIINDNVLTAYHPFYKVELPVVGFDIVFRSGEKLSSANNQFTIGMRNRIYCLKSGSLLSFENICYLMPDGSINKLKSFQLFVTETNKYKVGYRVWGL